MFYRHIFEKGPNQGITVILDAEICGGMLPVMMPLYRMHTRFPTRNLQDPGKKTRTVWLVRRSRTMRKSH